MFGSIAALIAANGCAESVAPGGEVDGDDASAGSEPTAGADGMQTAGRGGSPGTGGQPGPAGGVSGMGAGGGVAFSGASAGGRPVSEGGAGSEGAEAGAGNSSNGGKSGSGGANSSAGKASGGGGGTTGSAGRVGSGGAGAGGKASSGGAGSSAGGAGSSAGGSSPSGGSAPTGGTGGGAVNNLLDSSGFEAGTVDGWYKRGSATLAVSTAQAHTGTRSLLVSGRTMEWHGVEYDVESVVTPGVTYEVSVWARFATGSTGGLTLTRELTGCTGQTQFTRIEDLVDVAADTWVELSGTFGIPSDCVPTKLAIYVEASEATASYYIDDTLLTEP